MLRVNKTERPNDGSLTSVLCPRPGVPLSTQWGPQGYFYAIQIAQYGLSHYSKNLTERPPHVELYDSAEEKDSRASGAPWSVAKGCSLSRVHDKSRGTSVRQFSAPGEQQPDRLRGLSGGREGCGGSLSPVNRRGRRLDRQPNPEGGMIVGGESQRRRVNTDRASERASDGRAATGRAGRIMTRSLGLSLPLRFNETLSQRIPSESIVRLNLDHNKEGRFNKRKWPSHLPETVGEPSTGQMKLDCA